jgi:hypothetical protein
MWEWEGGREKRGGVWERKRGDEEEAESEREIEEREMNKQEYNELNLIISYIALLVSNGDWKPPRMGTYSAN